MCINFFFPTQKEIIYVYKIKICSFYNKLKNTIIRGDKPCYVMYLCNTVDIKVENQDTIYLRP